MTSQWRGSAHTAAMVLSEIRSRFGKAIADKYDPRTNCFTFLGWKERGYSVKKGEKAIKSVTFIGDEEEDPETGEVVKTGHSYPKNVYLFCEAQVEKSKF